MLSSSAGAGSSKDKQRVKELERQIGELRSFYIRKLRQHQPDYDETRDENIYDLQLNTAVKVAMPPTLSQSQPTSKKGSD